MMHMGAPYAGYSEVTRPMPRAAPAGRAVLRRPVRPPADIAALRVLGAIAALYTRGLVLQFQAGWESTFLSAGQVHQALSVLLGPASALTGIPIRDAVQLEGLRLPEHPGANAAPWIHLYAASLLIFIVVPRLLAATVLGLIEAAQPPKAVSFGWFAYQPLADAVYAPGPGPGWVLLQHRANEPAFLLTLVIALLFLWGVLSPRTQPWSALFRTLVRPRLAPPTELEDPRPPRFAQGVGLLVVTVGVLLNLFGVPWALPIATAMAFVAAFLNAAFGLCLGCRLYLLLQRAGILGRTPRLP